jgi:hypothetical protein
VGHSVRGKVHEANRIVHAHLIDFIESF